MWQPDPPDFISIAEAMYETRSGDQEWLAGCMEVIRRSLPDAFGTMIAVAQVDDTRVAIKRSWAETPEIAEFVGSLGARQPRRYLLRRLEQPVATDRQLMGEHFGDVAHAGWLHEHGALDMFCLASHEPDGFMVTVSAVLPRIGGRWPAALTEAWERTGVHLMTATRVRDAIVAGAARAEAVFDTNGRVVEATGEAVDHRASLREVVRRIARSRTRFRDKPDPIEARTPVVDARWTLVDQFDRDGRHFLVAYVVDNGHAASQLSDRERRVAQLLSTGASIKSIAYRLGLTPGTVASYASRACSKLGVRGRLGLAHALLRDSGVAAGRC